jgi:predicted enzyme related to lactoylglutathione lyase
MHKSRIGGIVIDCQTNDLDKEAVFWSQALGCTSKRSSDPDEENYISLETEPDEIEVLVQKVEHDSRVHIDIETDDIEAEVNRLEKLGAKRIGHVKRWCVMEAPSGHRFCVVTPQRSDFDDNANRWE